MHVFVQDFSFPIRSLEAELNSEILKAPYHPNGPLCSQSAVLLGGLPAGPAQTFFLLRGVVFLSCNHCVFLVKAHRYNLDYKKYYVN